MSKRGEKASTSNQILKQNKKQILNKKTPLLDEQQEILIIHNCNRFHK